MPKNTIITDHNLEVSIGFFLQYATPGIIEGCKSPEEAKERIHRVAKLILREDLEDDYIFIESTIETELSVLCLLRLTHNMSFRNLDYEFSSVTLIWFQESFGFESVRERVFRFPFREECIESKGPF